MEETVLQGPRSPHPGIYLPVRDFPANDLGLEGSRCAHGPPARTFLADSLSVTAIRARNQDSRYLSPLQAKHLRGSYRRELLRTLARPFEMLFLEPIVMCFLAYLTLVVSIGTRTSMSGRQN
jgi:hypothetical protein